jgi:HAD superfamily hydrolase (TIGR01509 family)
MSICAVLWDIDGTLVDSEFVHHEALLDALRLWGFQAPGELQQALIGVSMADTYAILTRLFPGFPDDKEFVVAKYRAYIARSSEIHLRRGAAEGFKSVAKRSLAQALVSNSDRIIVEANLRAVDFFEPGLVTVSRNDVRRGKPQPDPYLRAADLLEVAPRQCLVIEDSPTGAEAGLAAGMAVIAWPQRERRDLKFPADASLAHPDDLSEALRNVL